METHEGYCQTQDNPVSFPTFCDLKNVLLADSPKDQCRCLIHENLFLKLDAIGILYDCSFWTKVLCSVEDKNDGWNARRDDCKNGKKLVPVKLLSATTSLRQWEKVVVEKQNDEDEDESMDNVNKKKFVTKLQCWSEQVYVGEAVGLFEASSRSFGSCQYKRIQAKAFEVDKNKNNVRVHQMDFTMAYEYMYQDEVQSALWSRGSVNLFTVASISKAQSKAYLPHLNRFQT